MSSMVLFPDHSIQHFPHHNLETGRRVQNFPRRARRVVQPSAGYLGEQLTRIWV